jgi:hypothetical protein
MLGERKKPKGKGKRETKGKTVNKKGENEEASWSATR